MEQLKKEAEEAQRLALQDQVAAVELQKDVAMALIQEWQTEVQGGRDHVAPQLNQPYLTCALWFFSYLNLPAGTVPGLH